MSSFKKIAWSGSAVLLALVLSLGVMAQPTPASAAAEALSASTVVVGASVNLTGTVTGATNEVQTIAAGDRTGGTFTLNVPRPDTGALTAVAAISCTSTAAALATAVNAALVTAVGAPSTGTWVTAAGGALGTTAVTLTYTYGGNVAQATVTADTCTGGATSPSVTTTTGGANGTQTIAVASDASSTGSVSYAASSLLDNSPFDSNKLNGIYSLAVTGVSAGNVIINVTIAGTLTAQLSLTVTGAVVVPGGGATCVASTLCFDVMVLMPPGSSTTCTTAAIDAVGVVVNGGTTIGGPAGRPGQNPADGSAAAVICAHLSTNSTRSIDSNVTPLAPGTNAQGQAVTWTSSVGYLSTGTAKTTTSVVGSTGWIGTNYRGAGNAVATDTVIVSVQGPTSAVGTLAINLTAGSGTNPSKVAFNAPSVLAVAATQTNTSPNYQSPTVATNISVKVSDSAGLGVNNEQILISTDKGSVQAGFNAACGTSKAMTQPTATLAPAVGATAEAGIIQLTFCANQLDAPGKATLTAQNVTTTMANATVSVAMSGRPTKLEPTVTGAAIAVKVTDAAGNAVADGTPVRFTISPNAGAVSTACTTTTNGAASAVAALIANTGLVIISTDWNETGAFATCAAAGAQQLATSVNVSGGTATLGGGTGTGVLTSGSIPATGFGLIVFSGGTIAQLVTASGVGNTGALYATVGGIFVPYVPGTTIAAVNADFLAAFPGGNIPANTAFVGRK